MFEEIKKGKSFDFIRDNKEYLDDVLLLIQSQIDKTVTRVEFDEYKDEDNTIHFRAYRPVGDSEDYIIVFFAYIDEESEENTLSFPMKNNIK